MGAMSIYKGYGIYLIPEGYEATKRSADAEARVATSGSFTGIREAIDDLVRVEIDEINEAIADAPEVLADAPKPD